MTAIDDLVSIDQVASGRECLSTGDDDLAADYFRIAYRTEIARIVAGLDADASPGPLLVRPWSLSDMWAGWTALSLYHRANRDGIKKVEFYSDLSPHSPECSTQGYFWIDRLNAHGVLTRLLMPDAFLHVHTELARNPVVRSLLPDLVSALRASGQCGEAAHHEAEVHKFDGVARWR